MKCIQLLEDTDTADSTIESLDPLSRCCTVLHCTVLPVLYLPIQRNSLACRLALTSIMSLLCMPCSRHNFGTSPELLFKPCSQSTAGGEDGEGGQCFLGAGGRSYAYDPVIRLARPATDGKSNSGSNSVVNPVHSEEGTGKSTEGQKVGDGSGAGGATQLAEAEAEMDGRTSIKEFVSNQ
jgi:hypothetical protein